MIGSYTTETTHVFRAGVNDYFRKALDLYGTTLPPSAFVEVATAECFVCREVTMKGDEFGVELTAHYHREKW